MVRLSLKDHVDHGKDFFKYLSLTDRTDINERGKLYSIFKEEFDSRSSKYNFNTVLDSLKNSGHLEVTGQLITITSQFQKMIDSMNPSEWTLHLLKRTEPNRPETSADKVKISSTEHQFKDEKMSFSVEINTEDTVSLYIENTGSEIIHFIGYKQDCRSSNISLEDEHRATQEKPVVLHPGLKHDTCKIKFSAREVGVLSMKLSFEFREGFCIERIFEAHCVTPLGKELGPTAPYRPRPLPSLNGTPSSKVKIEDGQPPPGFPKRRYYKMKTYLHGLTSALKNPSSTDERKMLLEGNLKWENYEQRFHLLLDLERSHMELDLKRSNISNDDQQGVTMELDRFNKEFLIVRVPGLRENRVSVLRGDHVLVYPAQEKKLKYCLYVESVHQDTLKLGYNKKLLERYAPYMKFYIEFALNTVNIGIQHRAVTKAVTNNLKPVLFPDAAPSSAPLPDLKLYDKKLEQNPEQYQAVQHIVAGSSKPAPYLVFGPPGTGKTVTVAEAIKQVRKSQPSSVILACAPTNSAADQLCKNILEDVHQSSVLRIYAKYINPSEISSELKACSNLNRGIFDFPKGYKEKLMKYKVIITTLLTSSRIVTAKVPKGHFTHVFVDEAGQAMETECLLPLAGLLNPASGQVVLAGDPKQLGAIIKSPLALKFGLRLSLLERLMTLYKKHEDAFDKCFVTKLLHNYRSHPAIFTIPNELFYDGELKPFADKDCNLLCNWKHLPQKGFPVIFHEKTGLEERESGSPSFFNVAEVDVLMDYVKELLQTKENKDHATLSPKHIGIITPYWKQVQKIRLALQKEEKKGKVKDISSIKVGSVEEFQGQERTVILLSTVRSSPEFVENDKFDRGFVKDEKRFNVAITRAKALLIIVGNSSVLNSPAWKRFIDYCKVQGGYRDTWNTKTAPSHTMNKAGIKQPVTQVDSVPALQAFDPGHRVKTFDGILASSGYGEAEDKAQYIISSLAVSPQQKKAIGGATVGQRNNALWKAYRKNRVTASNFGSVLAAVKRDSYPPSLFKTLLGQYDLKEPPPAIKWGIDHEQEAKNEYMKRTGMTIQECGVFLSDSGLLGGSPDGKINDRCIIEVKCLFTAREKTITQAAEAKDFYLEKDEKSGLLKLKQTHKYWHQIQGNLYLTGVDTCDLVVWTLRDLQILPIRRDPDWANNITVLETFYKDRFLPHILSNLN